MLSLWALAAHLQMGDLMALCEVSACPCDGLYMSTLLMPCAVAGAADRSLPSWLARAVALPCKSSHVQQDGVHVRSYREQRDALFFYAGLSWLSTMRARL